MILKANHERDEHKWNAERLKLEAKINELERTLEQKDNERAQNETRLSRQHNQELGYAEADYEEKFDELLAANNKIKNRIMVLETEKHNQLLEHEKMNKLISSSFFHLGQIQVQKERKAMRQRALAQKQKLMNGGANQATASGVAAGTGELGESIDWLESQKNNMYAYDYEQIFSN